MTAWVLWVLVMGVQGHSSQQAALYPTKEMCNVAGRQVQEAFDGMGRRVLTVCTETRIVR